VEYQLQVCLWLLWANCVRAIGIPGDVVFECDSNLCDVLETKTAIHVAVLAGANVEQLREQLPHRRGDGLLLVSVVDNHGYALDALLN